MLYLIKDSDVCHVVGGTFNARAFILARVAILARRLGVPVTQPHVTSAASSSSSGLKVVSAQPTHPQLIEGRNIPFW